MLILCIIIVIIIFKSSGTHFLHHNLYTEWKIKGLISYVQQYKVVIEWGKTEYCILLFTYIFLLVNIFHQLDAAHILDPV